MFLSNVCASVYIFVCVCVFLYVITVVRLYKVDVDSDVLHLTMYIEFERAEEEQASVIFVVIEHVVCPPGCKMRTTTTKATTKSQIETFSFFPSLVYSSLPCPSLLFSVCFLLLISKYTSSYCTQFCIYVYLLFLLHFLFATSFSPCIYVHVICVLLAYRYA